MNYNNYEMHEERERHRQELAKTESLKATEEASPHPLLDKTEEDKLMVRAVRLVEGHHFQQARELIYTTHQGSDALNDEVTSLLIRCEDPTHILQITQQLEINLENIVGGNWSIVDLKTRTLENRYIINQWFIWLKEGERDEEVVNILSDYFESKGIILFSSVTKTFILKSFGTVMDYITTIISGVLIFAI